MDLEHGVSEVDSFPDIADCNIFDECLSPKERILRVLDRIEAAVERYRKEATIMEDEKDRLSLMLDAMQDSDTLYLLDENDQEDVTGYIERILRRFMTVEMLVKTNRNQEQEDALHRINSLIDELITVLKTNPNGSKTKCLSYLAACSSDTECSSDKKFESIILGCTMDDQKQIKKRLQGLLGYIDSELKSHSTKDMMT